MIENMLKARLQNKWNSFSANLTVKRIPVALPAAEILLASLLLING
jgi:hypothetical protein